MSEINNPVAMQKSKEEELLKSTYNENEGFDPLYVGKFCLLFKNHTPSGGNVAFWDHLHLTDQK